MVTKQAVRISLEDFLKLPETKPANELIDGEVCQKAMPKTPHSLSSLKFVRLLERDPGTSNGLPMYELGFNFPDSLRANHRVPDLSYYRPGRPIPHSPYPLESEMPDLVVEIRSEGQSRSSQAARLQFLRDHGVPCTLLIDPEQITVTVHELDREWTGAVGDVITLATIDGFTFPVSALFE
jgi:Uma2 family endonuclease